MDKRKIAETIAKGAGAHRIAERLILQIKPNTTWYRAVAAAKLAFLLDLKMDVALAIIEEMDA